MRVEHDASGVGLFEFQHPGTPPTSARWTFYPRALRAETKIAFDATGVLIQVCSRMSFSYSAASLRWR